MCLLSINFSLVEESVTRQRSASGMTGHYVNNVSFKAGRAFFYRRPVKQTNKKTNNRFLKTISNEFTSTRVQDIQSGLGTGGQGDLGKT